MNTFVLWGRSMQVPALALATRLGALLHLPKGSRMQLSSESPLTACQRHAPSPLLSAARKGEPAQNLSQPPPPI